VALRPVQLGFLAHLVFRPVFENRGSPLPWQRRRWLGQIQLCPATRGGGSGRRRGGLWRRCEMIWGLVGSETHTPAPHGGTGRHRGAHRRWHGQAVGEVAKGVDEVRGARACSGRRLRGRRWPKMCLPQ
jgi:hypothetical protein